ncbi:endo-1,4-beta-xylanase [uncultured Cellulomonas sp.]|uniref:endo-1,4-beta-xylanase n=1 Tax=uncultured Cellulomonas sp. TaxID=189682 RepID=UPI00260AD75B|nr:endo-1,4-beta-xylanase [uncultured Cellulomonas sp.]
MAATAAAAPTGTAVPTAVGDPVVVVSNDFENDSYDPWVLSGSPEVTIVEVDGDKALQVANRTSDFVGIQTPAGALEEGQQYTFSMQARLAEGTAGPTGVRFVMKPDFTWIGNTTMSADAWTTVTGTLTAPADGQVYIGTADLPGGAGAYTYLVDDLVITTPAADGGGWTPTPDPDFVPGGATSPTETQVSAARGTGDVAALTFDDGPNPGETEDLLDFLGENDLTATFCVIGQNIQAPGGAEILRRIVDEGHTLCNHTTTYADMGDWSQAEIEADLKANLQIIRDALGNPQQAVPYFRAPNGSWGATPEVAVALGMQPLGLGNVISDWDGNDLSEATLTANLRNAITPGAVVLVHDGGGVRDNGIAAVRTVVGERLADGWTFTLPAGGVVSTGPVVDTDFEDGLGGWVPRGSADGDPTVAVTTEEFHGGAAAALVSDRTEQGDGIAYPLTGLLTPGVTYDVTAWVKMAAGEQPDDIWLSMQRTTDGADAFDTVGQFADVPSSEWREVTASFTAQETDATTLYFETSFNGGGAGSFLLDDVVVAPREPSAVQDVTPLKSTVDFPVGVAIDSRETTGPAAELLTRHFNQVTGENYMKPEAWYDADGNFRINPEATALMDFAQENDLRVYGHVLVWHSQTPAFFFTDEAGQPLTDSAEDQQVLRDRMRAHIFGVAENLATTYGDFGSDTNPLVAWDVVNEVVSDSGEFSDGLRRSEWYRILGEDFIDLAFQYADEAFNGEYAAEGTDRPVTLFINDYNTEQAGKQDRYRALVERLLARDVPIDGVGHQFHVNLALPVSTLDAALDRFEDLPVVQVVTELDVTTGTPVTQANLIEQGYYYRDAFRSFREHADDLFSVTVWGLTDGRSWRSDSGAPLLFDDALQAKPAFFGAVDEDLDAPVQTANVFAGDIALSPEAFTAPDWSRLPLLEITGAGSQTVGQFQLRWAGDHLTAWIAVTDGDDEATDGLTFTVGGEQYTLGRDGEGDVDGVVTETETGWAAVVHLPLEAAELGDTVPFDVAVTDGDVTSGWNSPGVTGTLTLVEELSYTEAHQALVAPVIDGEVDASWLAAETVTTDRLIQGDPEGAEATVGTLWNGSTLYVLALVEDDTLDVSGSDPWIQDSLEIFIDTGNLKNGPYLYETSQLRINVDNVVSFGTGDEAYQDARLDSATTVVDGGYIVEAAIDLGDELSGLGTFHGLDFQVNDATAGARTAVKAWADPTGLGYQTSERWGVVQLVAPAEAPAVPDFADVTPDHVFYPDIRWMAERGLTTGTLVGDQRFFYPTAALSRQAMAAFMYRYSGEEYTPEEGQQSFSDVGPDDQFYVAIEWMHANDLANGYADGTYRPTAPVSRQAMAAFLYRLADSPEADAPEFSDVPADHQFATAIGWLEDARITEGYPDNTFRPTAPITRQAIAAFMHRFDDFLIRPATVER